MAWGCAAAFRTFGADLAITYLNDKVKKQVDPLACALQFPIVMPLGVRVPGQMEAVFDRLAKEWGKLDFVVHSIAFAPKKPSTVGSWTYPSKAFLTAMQVSWSVTTTSPMFFSAIRRIAVSALSLGPTVHSDLGFAARICFNERYARISSGRLSG